MAILVLLFLPYLLLAAAERTLPRIQAIHDSRDFNLVLHDVFVRVRCPSVLADPRDVLLRIVCVDHEKTVTVSLGCFFFIPACFSNQILQTHDQIPIHSL